MLRTTASAIFAQTREQGRKYFAKYQLETQLPRHLVVWGYA